MQDCTVKLGGQEWEVIFVTKRQMPKKTWGICKWEERKIYIRKDLSHKNILDTAIHEFRHGLHPLLFCAEQWVDHTSTELADALIKCGVVEKK